MKGQGHNHFSRCSAEMRTRIKWNVGCGLD